jgi:hypothetical protein
MRASARKEKSWQVASKYGGPTEQVALQRYNLRPLGRALSETGRCRVYVAKRNWTCLVLLEVTNAALPFNSHRHTIGKSVESRIVFSSRPCR